MLGVWNKARLFGGAVKADMGIFESKTGAFLVAVRELILYSVLLAVTVWPIGAGQDPAEAPLMGPGQHLFLEGPGALRGGNLLLATKLSGQAAAAPSIQLLQVL